MEKEKDQIIAFSKKRTLHRRRPGCDLHVLVHPDREYLEYLDYRVLALLFCLMLVIAGLQSIGLFRYLGLKLLKRTSPPERGCKSRQYAHSYRQSPEPVSLHLL